MPKEEVKDLDDEEIEDEENLEEEVEDEEEGIESERLMEFLQQRQRAFSPTLNQINFGGQETFLEQSVASAPVSNDFEENPMKYSSVAEENKAKYTTMSPEALSPRQKGEVIHPNFLDPFHGRGIEPFDAMQPQRMDAEMHDSKKQEEKKYNVEFKKRDY